MWQQTNRQTHTSIMHKTQFIVLRSITWVHISLRWGFLLFWGSLLWPKREWDISSCFQELDLPYDFLSVVARLLQASWYNSTDTRECSYTNFHFSTFRHTSRSLTQGHSLSSTICRSPHIACFGWWQLTFSQINVTITSGVQVFARTTWPT